MATSQAALATIADAVGGGTTSTTRETIAGWPVIRMDGFAAAKDLGVGKSIKSDTFRVGGHGWYIECFPCGVDEESAGWVTLVLCSQEDYHTTLYKVSADYEFTLMESLKNGCFKQLDGLQSRWVNFDDDDSSINIIKTKKLGSLLKDDCLHVRCLVLMEKLPAVPQPVLATKTISGSHVLTVDGYTKTTGAIDVGEEIVSGWSSFGGHSWSIWFNPCGKEKNDADGVTTYLCLDDPGADNEVKVRFEMTLLTHAGQKISSIQDFHTFYRNKKYLCKFLSSMEDESSSLLQDGIQIRCDIAAVKGIPEVQPPPNLATDVTFEVAGNLFSAHKCVLATRSTAFMAEFFGPAGKENAGAVTQVLLRIDDMEPRVFKALLHFIYTDTLPEVREEDKVVMARGLLVAADRYAMERLKLICADMLFSYIDATTAPVSTLELAEKHGCLKLKEACIKVIRDWLTKVTA